MLATPIAFSLPEAISCITGPMAPNAMLIWLPICACTTSAVPLYGTCSNLMPAAVANASVSRCVTLPGPKLPYESSPGFCLASSMAQVVHRQARLDGEDKRGARHH